MLKSRGLAYAFTATPSIITAFGGPAAAQSLLPNVAESPSELDPVWRWSFGSLAISLPVIVIPLYGILFWYERQAAAAATTTDRLQRLERLEPQSNSSKDNLLRRILDTMIKFDGTNPLFLLVTVSK